MFPGPATVNPSIQFQAVLEVCVCVLKKKYIYIFDKFFPRELPVLLKSKALPKSHTLRKVLSKGNVRHPFKTTHTHRQKKKKKKRAGEEKDLGFSVVNFLSF